MQALLALPDKFQYSESCMARMSARVKLILQLLPVLFIALAGIYGASQLQVVREFLAGASGEPADIVIDNSLSLGPVRKPWRNMAQGGEMHDWRIAPIKGKVAALTPEYIRLDHIYSFYDIVQKDGETLRFDFSKLDPLVDDIISVGAKPYISLSYMPTTVAQNGEIIDLPQKWEYWQEIVRATIQHYSGTKRISGVVYEVWNEPDLFGGFKTYGDKNYLTLYTYAARGQAQVRGAQPYKFGGPAITALYKNWFDRLVQHAQANNLRLDFFSWHRYNTDVDVFKKDYADAVAWRAQYPEYANLELHVTEYGHDSRNHAGYDNNMGAAHTAATSIEMVGKVDRGFVFEIEDGKDPEGKEKWGRWGVLTHHDFGANIKPRYLALRLMNRIEGEQLSLNGNGYWVKALSTRNGNALEILMTNYDVRGSHTENVPIHIKNVPGGNYLLEITDLNGSSRKVPVATEAESNEIRTNVFMGANTVILVRVLPQDGQILNANPDGIGPADALRRATGAPEAPSAPNAPSGPADLLQQQR